MNPRNVPHKFDVKGYHGLCVGGPLDRQMKVSLFRNFTQDGFGYEFCNGLHLGGRALDFWVPDGSNAEWAISRIVNCYSELWK